MLAQICSLCYVDGTDCKSAPAKQIRAIEVNPRHRSKSANLKICKFELFARFDYAQRPCIAPSRIGFDYAQPVRICNYPLQYNAPQIFNPDSNSGPISKSFKFLKSSNFFNLQSLIAIGTNLQIFKFIKSFKSFKFKKSISPKASTQSFRFCLGCPKHNRAQD